MGPLNGLEGCLTQNNNGLWGIPVDALYTFTPLLTLATPPHLLKNWDLLDVYFILPVRLRHGKEVRGGGAIERKRIIYSPLPSQCDTIFGTAEQSLQIPHKFADSFCGAVSGVRNELLQST